MRKLKDISGKTFGRWTAIKRGQRDSHVTYWVCRCSCGTEKEVALGSLISGDSTSCGCKFGLRSYECLYKILVKTNEGREKPLPMELSYEDFLAFTSIKECHYCDSEIVWTIKNTLKSVSGQGYHLDRKVNALGYVKENCVVCCTRCNYAKCDHFTYEEWVQIGALIKSWKTRSI